jgi:uncharacterized membrane protein
VTINASDQASRPPVTGRQRSFVIAADRVVLGITRHWLLFLNGLVFLYVGIPFLAPIFMEAGLTGPAHVIYTIYSGLCHQLGFRSEYLFGSHFVYPRAIFQQFTGIDPNDLYAARAFIGNAQLGWKVAFCERDVAIYAAILLGGLVFALPFIRERLRPLPWWAYVVFGVAPIAIDGFSQLFSQYPYNLLPVFNLLPYRESTLLLRTLTGSLFGLANAWLAIPYLAASMGEMRLQLETKLAKVDAAH